VKETPIKSTSRKAMHYRGVKCLNCGHPLDLTDRFCAYCGQINTTKRLTLKDFVSEFVLSVFTYDSRFWHTLKDLLFKPGTITRYYVDGKRFHYANPFRFFLSASIFYFIIVGLFSFFENENTNQGNLRIFGNDDPIEEEQLDEIFQDSLLTDIKGIPPGLNEGLTGALAEAKAEAIKSNREKKRRDSIKESKGLSYDYRPEKEMDSLSAFESFFTKFELFQEFHKATDIADTDKALDSLKYSKSKTNVWLYNKTEAIDRIEKKPIRFVNYLASKTPFFIFFFSPIYALFFWLIYSKKRANYMEHLVFIFHIFSWVFVVLLVCLIPDKLLPTQNLISSILLGLVGPFYFYKALRNFYAQSRVITLIKFVFLNIVFWIGTSVFALIFFALTAAFY
jgi:hypothetical protein